MTDFGGKLLHRKHAGERGDSKAIVQAIGATKLDTIVGHIEWGQQNLPPFAQKNIAKRPLVGSQWRLRDGSKYDIVITDNKTAPEIPVGGKLEPTSGPGYRHPRPLQLVQIGQQPGEDNMKVGFIGLGAMGRGMATRLISAGHDVHVWNRSHQPCEELARRGGRCEESPGGAFMGDAVITMLADDDAVRTTILSGDLLRTANKKLIHIVMSTVSAGFARELERAHADAGIAYISAPVMGRPDVAAAGKLNILAAGDSAAIERVRPLLDTIGQRIWLLGTEPHQANVAKLAMNFLLASAIEAMAEAATLAERYEIEPAKLMEVVTGTLFAAPAYATYGKLIVEGEFKPGFKLTLGLKDMRLVLAAGEAIGVPLPFASVVRDNLVDAIGHGDADKDWSALALVARRRAGSSRWRP